MGFRLAGTIVEARVGAGDPSHPVAPFTNTTSAPVIGSGAPGQQRSERQGDSGATHAKREGAKRGPGPDSADPQDKPAILTSHARSQTLTDQRYRGPKTRQLLSCRGRGACGLCGSAHSAFEGSQSGRWRISVRRYESAEVESLFSRLLVIFAIGVAI